MTKEEKYYTESCEKLDGAVKSQMFGKPCYKINGKAFASLFNNTMVFKLTGDLHSEALSLDGAEQFDPSGKGRPMKEWVQVSGHYMKQWEKFARGAYEYVKEITKQ